MGLIVAIDGIDGSGITTLAETLIEKLGARFNAVYSKEPGKGSYAGDLIYQYVRGRFGARTRPGETPEVETLLFAVDRYYQGLVDPAWLEKLREKDTVIVKDRYYYTSMVYQSYGFRRRGWSPEELEEVLAWIRGVNAWMPPAHLVVYLDVAPRIAAARLTQRLVRVTLNLYPLDELDRLATHARWFYEEWLPRHPETGEGSDWYPHLWEKLVPAQLYQGVYPVVCIAREEEKLDPREALEPLVEPLLDVIHRLYQRVSGGVNAGLPRKDNLVCRPSVGQGRA